MNEGVNVAFDLDSVRSVLGTAPEADRLHPVGLRDVVSGRGVIERLPEIVKGLVGDSAGQVAVLADATPMTYGDGDLHGDLKEGVVSLLGAAGAAVQLHLIGPPDGHVHADEATVDAVVAAVDGASVVVTVGSGTMADLGKVAAARGGGIPHVVVQTAASVNGFADDQSVLLVEGVKRTVPSGWADVLVIDPDVIARAPKAMNLAGVGDLVSMYTAPADWYLASAIGFETSYAPTLVGLVRQHGARLLEIAEHVAAADPGAVAELAELLTLSGITMGTAGRTAISSGMEHTVSHLMEMWSGSRPEPEAGALHGAQVGVTTVVAARTWQHVRNAIESGRAVATIPDPAARLQRIEEAFAPLSADGSVAAECWNAYRRKLEWLIDHPGAVTNLLDRWSAHSAVLDSLLVDPDTLASTLDAAGVPIRFADLTPAVGPDVARWAVANCHLMRDRFTIADLADLLGIWDDADVDAVLAPSGADR
jgi:glycerol-1-phosphate dehydrogenase [NAD(P)+]